MVGDGAGAHIHKFGPANTPEIAQLPPCWPHNPAVVRAILTLRMRHADATDEDQAQLLADTRAMPSSPARGLDLRRSDSSKLRVLTGENPHVG